MNSQTLQPVTNIGVRALLIQIYGAASASSDGATTSEVLQGKESLSILPY